MFSRIVTLIATFAHIELPIKLTFLLLFPFMGFFPPIIAVIYGKHSRNPRLSFMVCFLPIIIGELIYLNILEVFLYVPWVEFGRIFQSAYGLGLIGVGGVLIKKKTYKLGVTLTGIGLFLWIFTMWAGIVRWFILLLGGTIPY
jgi:hypothetical protein